MKLGRGRSRPADPDLDLIDRHAHLVVKHSTGGCADGCGGWGLWALDGVQRCTTHTARALRAKGCS